MKTIDINVAYQKQLCSTLSALHILKLDLIRNEPQTARFDWKPIGFNKMNLLFSILLSKHKAIIYVSRDLRMTPAKVLLLHLGPQTTKVTNLQVKSRSVINKKIYSM